MNNGNVRFELSKVTHLNDEVTERIEQTVAAHTLAELSRDGPVGHSRTWDDIPCLLINIEERGDVDVCSTLSTTSRAKSILINLVVGLYHWCEDIDLAFEEGKDFFLSHFFEAHDPSILTLGRPNAIP